ncbi:MAG: ADP-ribosylation factor-like protein [Candidatus Odinarchaeota archaeon]
MQIPEKIADLLTKKTITEGINSSENFPDMNITAIKGIGRIYSKALNAVGIRTIRELAVSEIEPSRLSQIVSRKFSIAAKIILKWSQEQSLSQAKIVLAGLDNAGKTTILKTLKRLSTADPSPTIGAALDQLSFAGVPIVLWDFGGQRTFRDLYLSSARYFKNIELLFFVIDVRDDRRDESYEYLSKILHLVNELGEKPRIIINLHKVDPGEEEKILLRSADEIENSISKLLDKQKENYQVSFVHSSIYNRENLLEEFSEAIKSISSVSFILDEILKETCLDLNAINVAVFSKIGFQIANYSDIDNEVYNTKVMIDYKRVILQGIVKMESEGVEFFEKAITSELTCYIKAFTLKEKAYCVFLSRDRVSFDVIEELAFNMKIWMTNLLTKI